jgi:hypothetical protein
MCRISVCPTGILYVDTALSYDYEVQSQYVLTVSVIAMAQTATGTLTVNILDKNEPHVLLNLPSSTSASVQDPTCQTNPVCILYLYITMYMWYCYKQIIIAGLLHDSVRILRTD